MLVSGDHGKASKIAGGLNETGKEKQILKERFLFIPIKFWIQFVC